MKRNIALVWGGYSSEAIVSKNSAAGIESFLDKEKYNVYLVNISKESWTAESKGKINLIDKNDFSFVDETTNKKVNLDFAYITIHGTPGEDGRLQGYFDMIGIPYSSSGVMTSALTMNKFVCNKYLRYFGITIANSVLIRKADKYSADTIIAELGLPVFIKPNNGGSSFATNRVVKKEELEPAVQEAFAEGDEVLIEGLISGTEVTCGCYRVGKELVVLPITEVVSHNEFFDYKAKYEGQVEEITPARLPDSVTKEIQDLTSKIYDLVGAKGIIRVDYFINANNNPILLEVNTTPGMTSTSFLPQQIAAAGKDLKEVLSQIIENEF